jgi:hypothetical protein
MPAPLTGPAALRILLCFALGWLSAAYFVAFAAMQLPLGIWLD